MRQYIQIVRGRPYWILIFLIFFPYPKIEYIRYFFPLLNLVRQFNKSFFCLANGNYVANFKTFFREKSGMWASPNNRNSFLLKQVNELFCSSSRALHGTYAHIPLFSLKNVLK